MTQPGHPTARSESALRVRYAETDAMGIAHHAEYLRWFEVGRTDWIRQVGPRDAHGERSYRRLEQAGFYLPVIEISARYHQPARYDDEIVVVTSLAEAGRVRLAFDYEIQRALDRETLTRGRTVHAVTDTGGRPRRLPPTVLAWLLGEDAPGPEAAASRDAAH